MIKFIWAEKIFRLGSLSFRLLFYFLFLTGPRVKRPVRVVLARAGRLFIRFPDFFCPFFPSVFLYRGILILGFRMLRAVVPGSCHKFADVRHSSACRSSRVLIDFASHSLASLTPFARDRRECLMRKDMCYFEGTRFG